MFFVVASAFAKVFVAFVFLFAFANAFVFFVFLNPRLQLLTPPRALIWFSSV